LAQACRHKRFRDTRCVVQFVVENMAAPEQQEMKEGNTGGDLIQSIFGPKESMLVKQTMRGCLQECMGCEAKSEYKVSNIDWEYLEGTKLKEGAMTLADELYILEESNCCYRICCKEGRPFVLHVTTGGEAGGQPVVQYRKPMGCPIMFKIPAGENGDVSCPCCCMLPFVTAFDPSNNELNKTRYVCDMCLYVPKFMYSEGGTDIYKIRPETCCMGCCIVCKCAKGKPSIPFYFWDPATDEKIPGASPGQEPVIEKVWAGMKKECCSTADNFVVMFPPGCDAKRKAGLIGSTMLVDFVFFEGRDQGE